LLDRLAGDVLAVGWDDATYVEGDREDRALTDEERLARSSSAASLPLLG
jgi:hypothetical protein